MAVAGSPLLPSTELAVLVPVYGCAATLPALVERLVTTLTPLGVPYRILLLDDASPDAVWSTIHQLAVAHPERVAGVRFARNRGQQATLRAGVELLRARWYAALDCDLQDEPEALADLWRSRDPERAVLGWRRRKAHAPTKRAASALFYRLYRLWTGLPADPAIGNQWLVPAPLAWEWARTAARYRHAALHFQAGPHRTLTVSHHPRPGGGSGYRPWRLLWEGVRTLASAPWRPGAVFTTLAVATAPVALAGTGPWATSFVGALLAAGALQLWARRPPPVRRIVAACGPYIEYNESGKEPPPR